MDAANPGRHAPGGRTPGESVTDAKRELRRRIRADRSRVDHTRMVADDRQRTALVLAELDGSGDAVGPGSWVACYSSRLDEPGTNDLLEQLLERGHRVLLPHLGDSPGRPIDWAELVEVDDLVAGPHGIDQPSGPGLGPEALAAAAVVICPGLAGTADGVRLGMGRGWYDRALRHRAPGVPVWLLLRDAEVVDALPHDEHDVPVDALFTPSRVVRVAG